MFTYQVYLSGTWKTPDVLTYWLTYRSARSIRNTPCSQKPFHLPLFQEVGARGYPRVMLVMAGFRLSRLLVKGTLTLYVQNILWIWSHIIVFINYYTMVQSPIISFLEYCNDSQTDLPQSSLFIAAISCHLSAKNFPLSSDFIQSKSQSSKMTFRIPLDLVPVTSLTLFDFISYYSPCLVHSRHPCLLFLL
jgi:hypothetical protein